MGLYLVEANIRDRTTEELQTLLDQVAKNAVADESRLIEAHVGEDLQHIFVILETSDATLAQQIVESEFLKVSLVKEVRLIGQDLDTVKLRKGKSNYLVEWNLPVGLTMEAYLKRKAEKTPLYAEVPDISFERTYVCEDLSKCLCFYDSPDSATVKQAREVVGAQIDTLTPIRNVH